MLCRVQIRIQWSRNCCAANKKTQEKFVFGGLCTKFGTQGQQQPSAWWGAFVSKNSGTAVCERCYCNCSGAARRTKNTDRELIWYGHDPKICISVPALAFKILGAQAIVEILLTTPDHSCWLPTLIVSNMQIPNTYQIQGPCWQRDMVDAAKHNGYHVTYR